MNKIKKKEAVEIVLKEFEDFLKLNLPNEFKKERETFEIFIKDNLGFNHRPSMNNGLIFNLFVKANLIEAAKKYDFSQMGLIYSFLFEALFTPKHNSKTLEWLENRSMAVNILFNVLNILTIVLSIIL